jgi:hypothetical protein
VIQARADFKLKYALRPLKPAWKIESFNVTILHIKLVHLKLSGIAIKNHTLLFMCLHGGETNAILAGHVGTKIFNK